MAWHHDDGERHAVGGFASIGATQKNADATRIGTMLRTEHLQSVQDEDWVRKPLVVIVVPALSDTSVRKIFPALGTLFTAVKNDFEVWALDAEDLSTETFRRDHLQPHLPEPSHDFLECCDYKRVADFDDWRTLTQLLQHTTGPDQNVVIWFAGHGPENDSLMESVGLAHKRITPSILQGWTRVLVEPPLSRAPRTPWEPSQMYYLHPLLASPACQQVAALRRRHWTRALWAGHAVQAVRLRLRTAAPAFAALPQLYHVMAGVAMDPPAPGQPTLEDAVRGARIEALAHVSPYCRPQDLLVGIRTRDGEGESDAAAGGRRNRRDPTYVCVRCWVGSKAWTGVPFFLEVLQSDEPSLDDTVDIRMDLRDSTCHDSLTFGDTGARLAMKSIATQADDPTTVEMNLIHGNAGKILDGRSRLAIEAFRGTTMLFVSTTELDAIHAVVDPLVRQCKSGFTKFYDNDEGPAERHDFLNDIRSPTSIE